MFLPLLSIEWTRLSRRGFLWFTLAACPLYAGLSLANFYNLNQTALRDGTLKMPGLSFDLANSLDQLLIAMPLLLILAAAVMGSDYSERTNQRWLIHASRASSLLAKLTVLAFVV